MNSSLYVCVMWYDHRNVLQHFDCFPFDCSTLFALFYRFSLPPKIYKNKNEWNGAKTKRHLNEKVKIDIVHMHTFTSSHFKHDGLMSAATSATSTNSTKKTTSSISSLQNPPKKINGKDKTSMFATG